MTVHLVRPLLFLLGFSVGMFMHMFTSDVGCSPVRSLRVQLQSQPAAAMQEARTLVIAAPNNHNAAVEAPRLAPKRAKPAQAALLPAKPIPIVAAAPAPGVAAAVFQGAVGPALSNGRVLATAGPNKGKPCEKCIFVAVTTCCKTWNVTRILLHQLLQSNDNIHVAVFDDMTQDDSKANVEALGVTVVQPVKGKGIGLTWLMNLAWRYYYARPELDNMFIMNNDLQISPDNTFFKLNRCLADTVDVDGKAIVVGPMTSAIGLGTGTHLSAYLSWQNAEHSRHRPLYHDQKIPEELANGLPGTLVPYNKWLEDTLSYMKGQTSSHVKTLMGFMMGFKRSHPLHDPAANRFIHGSRNSDQEYYMFQTRKDINAYVCHDVFVYHDKTSVSTPHIRDAMLKNMQQTNKKNEAPGKQS